MTDELPPPPTGGPPPGWYQDGGQLRWWDGQAWGPLAPNQPDEETGKVLSILCHLSFFIVGFILPLVVRVTEGQKQRYVRHHSTEALNFSITFMIFWLSAFVGMFVSLLVTGSTDTPPWPFFALFPLMLVMYGLGAACAIVGAVRAGQGRWWRYPVSIRFVRGAAPRHA